MGVKLWVDDKRDPKDWDKSDWSWVTSINEAIRFLAKQDVVEVSLDHDICHEREGYAIGYEWEPGYKIACADSFEAVAWFIAFSPFGVKKVWIHTDNMAGKEAIENVFKQVKGHGIEVAVRMCLRESETAGEGG